MGIYLETSRVSLQERDILHPNGTNGNGHVEPNGLERRSFTFAEKIDGIISSKFPIEKELDTPDLEELTNFLIGSKKYEQQLEFGNTTARTIRVTKRSEERGKDIPFPRDSALWRVVREARRAYKKYGLDEDGLADIDDCKAETQLTTFDYSIEVPEHISKNGRVDFRELVSLRYVPYEGDQEKDERTSTDDCDIYVLHEGTQKIPLIEAIRRETGDPNIEQRVVTQSRFCTVRPFVLNDDEQGSITNALREDPQLSKLLKHNRYSNLGFFLASQQYFRNREVNGEPPAIITGMLHDHLVNGILSFNGKTLPFTPGWEFLGIPYADRSELSIDKADPTIKDFANRHPGYFSEVEGMVEVIDGCIGRGWVSEETLRPFFSRPWSEIRERKSMTDWAGFGTFLTDEAKNNPVARTIRMLINDLVPDGPVLRIMRQEDFAPAVDRMIEEMINSENFQLR